MYLLYIQASPFTLPTELMDTQRCMYLFNLAALIQSSFLRRSSKIPRQDSATARLGRPSSGLYRISFSSNTIGPSWSRLLQAVCLPGDQCDSTRHARFLPCRMHYIVLYFNLSRFNRSKRNQIRWNTNSWSERSEEFTISISEAGPKNTKYN